MLFVLTLASFVLRLSHEARRKVRDADSGFSFVDVLTAVARGAVGFDFKIFIRHAMMPFFDQTPSPVDLIELNGSRNRAAVACSAAARRGISKYSRRCCFHVMSQEDSRGAAVPEGDTSRK